MWRELLAAAIAATVPISAAHAAPSAGAISVEARLSQGLIATGGDRKIYLRIGIKGDRGPRAKERPPLNLALVLDRSGSMEGLRIAEAKRAARIAVDRLQSSDIVSVVGYDSTTEVLVPATKPGDRRAIERRIDGLVAGGSTAIYAGVETGAAEIAKFAERNRVNRIILLSDGLANVGPQTPDAFAALGRQLSARGITVSTIGLGSGYNEDLMVALARTGEGNHAYVQEPADLANFFDKEFDDAASVIAQDVEVIIKLHHDARPIRSLGRAAEIAERTITYKIGQLIGGSEQVLVSELLIPDLGTGSGVRIAEIDVRYRPADGGDVRLATAEVAATATTDPAKADSSYDATVMQDVTLLEARIQREEAIKLRDAGKAEEAQRVFSGTASYLRKAQERFNIEAKDQMAAEIEANETAAAKPQSREEWQRQRKVLRSIESNQAGASAKY